jgi:hypothetical protein
LGFHVNSSTKIFIVGSIFGERALWVKSQARPIVI